MMKKAKIFKPAAALCALLVLIMIASASPAFAASDGGWSVSKARYSFLTSSQKKIFNASVKKLTGVTYKPVALIAKQAVSGTNYVFLCQGTTVSAKPVKAWYILTAYKNLKKKVSLKSIKKINIKNIKTNTNPRTKTASGGLSIVTIKNKSAALSNAVGKIYKKALKTYTGYELRPVALLGTQVVAGKNYKLLCFGTGYAGKDLFVVTINKNLKGKCKITSCKPLNLEKYVG